MINRFFIKGIFGAGLLCILSQAGWSQSSIDRPSNYYTYKDQIIKREEVGHMILASDDEVAISHYRSFQRKYVGGLVLLLTGAVLTVTNLNASIETTTPSPFLLVGIGTTATGVFLLSSGGRNLDRAVDRFNATNKSTAHLRIGSNGFSLVYRFR